MFRELPDQTRLRGVLFLSLTEALDVLRPISQDDQGGGITQTWGTVGTAVPCRIDPAGGGSGGVQVAKIDERSTHRVLVPPTADVLITDRVAIATRGTFEVLSQQERTGAQAQTFEVVQVD